MNTIHLLSLGNADLKLLEELHSPLKRTLDAVVDVRPYPIALEPFYDDSRGQYNSTRILSYLKQHWANVVPIPHPKRRTRTKVLAIIPHDLFIPILTYVFGEAELGGNVAIVSYHRLQNERYGLPPNPNLLGERIRKEALHELGHAFGLLHCESQECVMHTSTYVEDIDIKGGEYCNVCKHLMH